MTSQPTDPYELSLTPKEKDFQFPQTTWQPISTAPKDGTLVLIWCKDGSEPSLAKFDNGWRNNHYGERESYWHFAEVTHWQPAPEKPQ